MRDRAAGGVVVVYPGPGAGDAYGHESATCRDLAIRLAALKRFDFAGEYDPAARYSGPTYFVPRRTIAGFEEAHALGIRSEHDLFGGVVPYAFAATKAITHPLVGPGAASPAGWSDEFAERVRNVVLSGFTVFSLEDARRAGTRLLERGPARIKSVRETGGRGQIVVADEAGLQAALAGVNPAELADSGLVIEENLERPETYSVGQVRVADLVASYWGMQRLTRDNAGAEVYGGSDLTVVRGGFEVLLSRDLPDAARLAIAQAQTYDEAAFAVFSGAFASRRNYDIARGLDSRGRIRCGVLEQSWRIGGASGAEIAALEALRADPSLEIVRARSVESYGDRESPPQDAVLSFKGVDPKVGAITKYTLVEAHGDAR